MPKMVVVGGRATPEEGTKTTTPVKGGPPAVEPVVAAANTPVDVKGEAMSPTVEVIVGRLTPLAPALEEAPPGSKAVPPDGTSGGSEPLPLGASEPETDAPRLIDADPDSSG